MKLEDCPICGCTALVGISPDPRFAWGNYGYMAHCSSESCNSSTYTRHSPEAATESWNCHAHRMTQNALLSRKAAQGGGKND